MNEATSPDTIAAGLDDRQLSFLEDVDERASIAGDVLEIDANTWAIHGSVALDGDVILAEYATERAALNALAELAGFERNHRHTTEPGERGSP